MQLWAPWACRSQCPREECFHWGTPSLFRAIGRCEHHVAGLIDPNDLGKSGCCRTMGAERTVPGPWAFSGCLLVHPRPIIEVNVKVQRLKRANPPGLQTFQELKLCITSPGQMQQGMGSSKEKVMNINYSFVTCYRNEGRNSYAILPYLSTPGFG